MGNETEQDKVLRRTSDVITDKELENTLEKDNPQSYIGFAPTGTLHIGHVLTMGKIPDFQEVGIDNKVLVADEHARLDAEKSDTDLVEERAKYYEEGLRAIVEAVGGDEDNIEFVLGSEFQFDEDYVRSVRKMKHNHTANRIERALGEVVDRNEDGEWNASVYDYPTMQAQDVPALDADIAYSGGDQRSIYMFAREALSEEDNFVWIAAPMLSGLTGGKMSSSREDSKISIHDSPEEVERKILGAHMEPENVENNGVLEYAEHFIFPYLDEGEVFEIQRDDEYGGDLEFRSYENLEDKYAAGDLHPEDVKVNVSRGINNLLEPVRERFSGQEELLRNAYPEKF